VKSSWTWTSGSSASESTEVCILQMTMEKIHQRPRSTQEVVENFIALHQSSELPFVIRNPGNRSWPFGGKIAVRLDRHIDTRAIRILPMHTKVLYWFPIVRIASSKVRPEGGCPLQSTASINAATVCNAANVRSGSTLMRSGLPGTREAIVVKRPSPGNSGAIWKPIGQIGNPHRSAS